MFLKPPSELSLGPSQNCSGDTDAGIVQVLEVNQPNTQLICKDDTSALKLSRSEMTFVHEK